MVACERDLAVMSFSTKVSVSEALALIERLERANSLAIVEAVLIEREDDDSLHVSGLSSGTGDNDDLIALTWLIREMLESSQHSSKAWHQAAHLGRSGVSGGFIVELQHVLPTATVCLALVVSGLDATAAVAELRGFNDTRLVYGTLPVRALSNLPFSPLAGVKPVTPLGLKD
jgi:uncharacterized membrane protein